MQMSKMLAAVSGLLLMVSCGCLSSYRYSVKVLSSPQKPIPMGSFSVQSCGIKDRKEFPMNIIEQTRLKKAMGESDYTCEVRSPITLCLKTSNYATYNGGFILNLLSLGILPFPRERSAIVLVSVEENGRYDPARNFTLQIKERELYTPFGFVPLGLWTFYKEDYGGECYSVGVGVQETDDYPKSAFNEVLGWGLLSGLTADFK